MTETAEQLRLRHLKWIDLNLKTFAAEAPKAYREHGRGAFIATAAPGPPGLAPLEYWTEVEDLPDDEDGLRILAMIHQYDPAKQFVVVIREPDDYGVHAYVVGLR